MKIVIAILVVIFSFVESYGQFTLGPKIGYSASKLSTDFDDIKTSSKNNFQIGAFLRIGKKFYLQPEVFYATSGGTLKLEGTDLEENIKMKNICVPALIGYSIIHAKAFNLRVMAGPSANFIINKEVKADDLITEPLQDSNFKNIAWGFDLGAGVDVFFLTLDVRYEFGLNNIYSPPDAGASQKIKNNAFIVSLGFKLL